MNWHPSSPRRWAFAVALAFGAALAGPALAQPEKGESVKTASAEPEWVADPAFDRYVDTDLLLQAWSQLDPELLADVGLQLAEGERVLRRPHKSVPADKVLAMAVKAALEKDDKATLDRLGKAATALERTELTALLRAQRLGGKSRAAQPGLSVNLAEAALDQVIRYAALLEELRAAKLAGNAEAIGAIEKGLPGATGFTKEQRTYAAKLLEDAKQAVKGAADPTAKLLNKLAGESRSGAFLGVQTYFDGTGRRITQVFPNTPAQFAGLATNDVIVAANGQPVADLATFNSIIQGSGGVVQLDVLRGGQSFQATVQVGGSPQPQPFVPQDQLTQPFVPQNQFPQPFVPQTQPQLGGDLGFSSGNPFAGRPGVRPGVQPGRPGGYSPVRRY